MVDELEDPVKKHAPNTNQPAYNQYITLLV